MSLQVRPFPQMAFAPADIIADIGKFTELADVGHFSLVCKTWNQAMEYNIVWSEQFKKHGIPRVFGSNRNLKNDFATLYPITLSGKVIQKYFGRIGKLPFMDQKKFDALVNQDDPWEAKTKMHRTFKVIVDPDYIIRPYEKTLFDILDKAEEILPTTEGANAAEMRIPFSLKNRKLLADHLFARNKNGPIFDCFEQNVLDQCNLPITETALYMMRKEVVGRSLPYAGAQGQQGLVKTHHLEIIPLAIRILFDTVEILESGTCPDKGRDPMLAYARTSNVIRVGNNDYPVSIGSFTPGEGLCVISNYDADDGAGVAPGVPAEVRTLDIGTLD